MTKDEAISIVRQVAEEEHWLWNPSIDARRIRRWWLFGPWRWHIMTGAGFRGCNIYAEIDDVTGEIIDIGFAPR